MVGGVVAVVELATAANTTGRKFSLAAWPTLATCWELAPGTAMTIWLLLCW